MRGSPRPALREVELFLRRMHPPSAYSASRPVRSAVASRDGSFHSTSPPRLRNLSVYDSLHPQSQESSATTCGEYTRSPLSTVWIHADDTKESDDSQGSVGHTRHDPHAVWTVTQVHYRGNGGDTTRMIPKPGQGQRETG